MSLFDILLIIWLAITAFTLLSLLRKKKYKEAGRVVLANVIFGGILAMGWYLPSLELWGYWTLPLGLLFFFYIFVRRLPKFAPLPDRNQLLRLAFMSGIFLSVGFPPVPLVVAMFGGFIPLLWVEHRLSESQAINSRKSLFAYGFLTFSLWNILTTYWIMNSSFISGACAVLINSFLMTLPLVAFHEIKKIFPRAITYAVLPIFWLGFEYLHFQWEIDFPWLTLGNGLAMFPELIQWYEFTGVLGGTLWVLAVNISIFLYLKKGILHKSWKNGWLTPVLIVLIPILVSLFLYQKNKAAPNGERVEVVAIQGNVEPHYEASTISEEEKIRRFQQLAAEVLTDSTDFLIFPETSFESIWKFDIGVEDALTDFKKFIRVYPDLKLIGGISMYAKVQDSLPPPNAMAYTRGEEVLYYYQKYNAAVQLDANSDTIPIHFKNKLVVGAEKVPYERWLKGMSDYMELFGGTAVSLGRGEGATVFESGKNDAYKIAPVICYEQDFGAYVGDYVRNGANALFIMTNDGWWDNTSGYRQHLHFARLRAIETRRYVARAANTGSSAFINHRGDILASTNYNEAIALKGTVILNNTTTFYVRYGDYVGKLAAVLSMILLLGLFFKRLVQNLKMSKTRRT